METPAARNAINIYYGASRQGVALQTPIEWMRRSAAGINLMTRQVACKSPLAWGMRATTFVFSSMESMRMKYIAAIMLVLSLAVTTHGDDAPEMEQPTVAACQDDAQSECTQCNRGILRSVLTAPVRVIVHIRQNRKAARQCRRMRRCG